MMFSLPERFGLEQMDLQLHWSFTEHSWELALIKQTSDVYD